MIAFGHDICTHLEQAAAREWFETNGLGGFASSTAALCHTRPAHSLLTVSDGSPFRHRQILNDYEEQVTLYGNHFDLSTHHYPGVVHPTGYRFLWGFRLDPWPVWTYRFGSEVLERVFLLVHGSNIALTVYRLLKGDAPMTLTVRPLLTGRTLQELCRKNDALRPKVEIQTGVVRIHSQGDFPEFQFHHNAVSVRENLQWYLHLDYPREKDTEGGAREDAWSPVEFSFTLRPGQEAILAATTDAAVYLDASVLMAQERARRKELISISTAKEDAVQQLLHSVDQFVVGKKSGQSAFLPALPTPLPRLRDQLIALAGTLVATGRFDDAREMLLQTASQFNEDNFAVDHGGDTQLWWVNAVWEYAEGTRDYDFVLTRVWKTLRLVIEAILNGRIPGVWVSEDGLLNLEYKGVPLTWMNERKEGIAITPRAGKPVEAQALWYNALRIAESFALEFGEPQAVTFYRSRSEQTLGAFHRRFWYEPGGYLADVVGENGVDASLRPNQLLAVSLPFPLLNGERAKAVVDLAANELLTRFGIRTLSRGHRDYEARLESRGAGHREKIHQGAAWPWLMGPFITAYRRVYGNDVRSHQRVREWLSPLLASLWEDGLGHFAEYYDAEAPQVPRGAAASCISLAEIIRILRNEKIIAPHSYEKTAPVA